MCLNHKQCKSIDEFFEHLSKPTCMASEFVTQICLVVMEGVQEDVKRDILRELARAPESQLDKFYQEQAARLLGN